MFSCWDDYSRRNLRDRISLTTYTNWWRLGRSEPMSVRECWERRYLKDNLNRSWLKDLEEMLNCYTCISQSSKNLVKAERYLTSWNSILREFWAVDEGRRRLQAVGHHLVIYYDWFIYFTLILIPAQRIKRQSTFCSGHCDTRHDGKIIKKTAKL